MATTDRTRADYEHGVRAAALGSVGRAILFALEDCDCTPEQVMQACAYALDPVNRATAVYGARGVDSTDYAVSIAAGMEVS